MIRIGITGQTGFIGTHLFNTLGLFPDKFERVPFLDSFFQKDDLLRNFVKKCDVVVHLAAMNRHPDPKVIYETNINLIKSLINSFELEKVRPYVLFSSSTQEIAENEYGKSKREGRILLEQWAKRNNASFTGFLIPNVFGPFGLPNYNSFIATFCHKLVQNEQPQVIQDSNVNLIYVGSLCMHIIESIRKFITTNYVNQEFVTIPWDFEKNVSKILDKLTEYKELYLIKGHIPSFCDLNEINLFNTFRSFIDYNNHFPVQLIKHEDNRGVFVETIKLGIGGQVSFSTTIPGITRGNHYHTRKIERFTVIKGKARIQIRKIGSSEIINYELDGTNPSYVDMPVWYTHNITNIGNEELYTQFWINEWYNPEDGDTYFETV
jgi:UDP-2-acetamido-2,6-beta-L-arabino-hexul-4-ose reductase